MCHRVGVLTSAGPPAPQQGLSADHGRQRTRPRSCSRSPGRCSACATQISSVETRPLKGQLSLNLGVPLGERGSPQNWPLGPQPHLHVGMSRRNERMRTTASQNWRRARRQGQQGPPAHRGCLHCWPQTGPRCWVSQGAGPLAPHRQCCTWPCAGPACGRSPPLVPGCQPCSALSTRPASTRPGGGPAASPFADLRVPGHQSHVPDPGFPGIAATRPGFEVGQWLSWTCHPQRATK